jgi:predicted RNase H-like nuclease
MATAPGALRLLGIDACSEGGWVVAESDPELQALAFSVVHDLRPVRDRAARGEGVVAVDIPIGLPADRPRGSDLAARAAIGPRRSSVFPAPSRAALAAMDYLDACERNAVACGTRLSRQAHAILPRIRQVDALIEPALQQRFRECHPEVTFAVLAGQPLRHPKKTAEGRAERLALLAAQGLQFDLAAERRRLGLSRVSADDLIDAVACLVTAYRISRGIERSLPEGREERDARGLKMEIVA